MQEITPVLPKLVDLFTKANFQLILQLPSKECMHAKTQNVNIFANKEVHKACTLCGSKRMPFEHQLPIIQHSYSFLYYMSLYYEFFVPYMQVYSHLEAVQ